MAFGGTVLHSIVLIWKNQDPRVIAKRWVELRI